MIKAGGRRLILRAKINGRMELATLALPIPPGPWVKNTI